MKKVILLFVGMLCMALSLHSQSKYGVEIGGIYNNMFVSNNEVAPKFSYRAGGFVNYSIFDSDIMGAGIYYVKKGVTLSEFIPQYAGYIQKMDVSMNYIELVPISMRFLNPKNSDSKKFRVVPVLSLYASYGFSGNGTLTGVDENNRIFTKKIDNIFKDYQFVENNVNYGFEGFKSFDIGGKLGLDCIYKQFIFRLNWTGGLINISSYDKKLKNNSLDLSFCYLFK
jgi:hypothetical protein